MAKIVSNPSVPFPKAAEKAEIHHRGVRNRRTESAFVGPSPVTGSGALLGVAALMRAEVAGAPGSAVVTF